MDDEPELWQDQQRLYNFLKHYDLLHYHKKFLEKGVRRLSHLKDVVADDASLDEIGLSRPERNRLRKKVKENVEWMGRFMKRIAGKQNRFDEPAPQVAHTLMEMDNQSRTAAIITKDQITLGQRIGEGAHGSVFEGTWANVHGSVAVAVKTLYGRQEVQGQFIKEANSMCSLNHRHIIQLYGIVLSHPLMLVEELAPCGSLYKYLKDRGHTLNLDHFHTYASQIAEAMKYLEGRRVVHRDLATRNILLTNQNYVKLSDFGMARVLDDNSEVYNLSNLNARIPIAWTAPEALTKAKFSTSSDVWSYGIVLWEIYTLGKIPWDGLSPIEIRDLLLQGERLARPDRCPLDMYEVMLECWEPSPLDRPPFSVLVQKVEMIVSQKVRALKPHFVDDDDSLSFKNGELIFLIDKPKPGWMFGMTDDGKIGHFLADHVTTYLDPVGDLKEKIITKKVKASDMSISRPSDVDHAMHWGSDGKKWVSENSSEKELDALVLSASPKTSSLRRTNGAESGGSSGGSSPCPGSPPFKVIRSPSPGSSKASDSPLLQHNQTPVSPSRSVSSGSAASTIASQPQPYLHPVSHDVKTGEPIFGEITHGDTKFIGKLRYVTHTHVSDGKEEKEEEKEEQESSAAAGKVRTADLIQLNSDSPPLTPERSYKRLQSEDNQYISMSRTSTLIPELVEQLRDNLMTNQDQTNDLPFNPDDDTDPTGGYMMMRSYPIHLQKQKQHQHHLADEAETGENTDVFTGIGAYREEAPSYGTVRQRIQSAPGETSYLVHNSKSNDQLPDPLLPVISSHVKGVDAATLIPSQYSLATAAMNERGGANNTDLVKTSKEEALVPSSVRYIYQRPTATPSAATLASTSSVSRPGAVDPLAPPVPMRPGRGHEHLAHGSSTRPTIQRGKLKSESDAGDFVGASAIERPPVVPPKPPPHQQHRHATDTADKKTPHVQVANKSKKPPMPPPRKKTNPGPSDIAHLPQNQKPTPSPRNSGIGVSVSGGGGASATAAAHLNVKTSGGTATSAVPANDQVKIQTLILSDPEFQSCAPEVCLQALKKHSYEMKAAKEEIRVHMLLEMQVPYIDAQDCRRALSHCQQKMDRAAAWLLELSDEIESQQ